MSCTAIAATLAALALLWPAAQPGDRICLADGVHVGGARIPPRDYGGVTFAAETDGGARIDGQFTERSLWLDGVQGMTVEGLDVVNSSADGLLVIRSSDITLRRVVIANAEPLGPNRHVLSIAESERVRLEDVAAFGTGRKMLQIYRSEDVTLQRVWTRWDGWGRTNTQSASLAYRSYDVTADSVLSFVWGGNGIQLVDQQRGSLGMDWMEPADDVRAWAMNLRVSNSVGVIMAPLPNSQTQPGAAAALWMHGGAIELTDVVGWADRTDPIANGSQRRPMNFGDCKEGRCVLDGYVVGGGSAGPKIDPSWEVSGEQSDPWTIACPLLPWPMRDRIWNATSVANGTPSPAGTLASLPFDVHGELTKLWGPPPSACP